jgi:hypothetical protein
MKKKSIIASIFVAMFFFVATAGLAVAEEPITGTITEKGEMMVLNADDGSYVLEGDVAPEMVGKKVKVTGTVAEKDDMKVISVTSLEEVTE